MNNRKRYTGVEYSDKRKPWLAERVTFCKRKLQIIKEMENRKKKALDQKKRELLAKYY